VAGVNAASYAISARGFNNSIGNKLLVLIDGRTVYTPLCAFAPAANAQSGACYSTGQGPIMTCFEGNRQVQVHKSSKYNRDGLQYVWDHQVRAYCYRNEYGNTRKAPAKTRR
jgi:hypothetical protein